MPSVAPLFLPFLVRRALLRGGCFIGLELWVSLSISSPLVLNRCSARAFRIDSTSLPYLNFAQQLFGVKIDLLANLCFQTPRAIPARALCVSARQQLCVQDGSDDHGLQLLRVCSRILGQAKAGRVTCNALGHVASPMCGKIRHADQPPHIVSKAINCNH